MATYDEVGNLLDFSGDYSVEGGARPVGEAGILQKAQADAKLWGPNKEFTQTSLSHIAPQAGLPANFDWTPSLPQAAAQHQAQFGEPYSYRYTNYAHPVAAAVQAASASLPQLAPFVAQVGEGSAFWNQGNQLRDQVLHSATSDSDWKQLASVFAGPVLSAALTPAATGAQTAGAAGTGTTGAGTLGSGLSAGGALA